MRILNLKWRPLVFGRDTGMPDYVQSGRVQRQIAKVLGSWERTPYGAGQQCKGTAVDCVRFFAGVVDELYGYSRVSLDRMPQDMAMHTPAGAYSVLKRMLRTYPELERIEDGSMEPMDVLVVGHRNGGPGHVMLVGYRRNTLWHAGTRGVCWTGIGLDGEYQRVKRVYRFRNRAAWDPFKTQGRKK